MNNMKICAGVILSALSCAAMAQTAASASASISNLGFHLVDLDPNDGITPWVKFNLGDWPASRIYLDASNSSWTSGEARNESYLNGTIFGPGTISLASADGNAQALKNGSNFTTSASATAAQLGDAKLYSVADGYASYNAYAGFVQGLDFGDIGRGGAINYEISPRTRLVIDGQAALSASVNPALLDDSELSSLLQTSGRGILLTASASLTMMMYPFEQGISPAKYALSVHASDSTAPYISVEDRQKSDSQTDNFSLIYDNSLDTASRFTWSYSFGSIVDMTAQYSVLPELDRSVMSALGLALLAWRVRSRKAA